MSDTDERRAKRVKRYDKDVHWALSTMPVCPLCLPSWEQGPWTQCSASCGQGGGWQVRSMLCMEEDMQGRFSQVDEWKCTHSPRPVTQQICNTFACPQWVAMEWSQVSGSVSTRHTVTDGGHYLVQEIPISFIFLNQT